MAKINIFEYAERTSAALDKRFVKDGVTGFLEANSSDIEFTNAKTCWLSELDMSGLGDYSRNNGFPKGSLAEIKRSYELTMDRGRSFQLDRMDADEAMVKGATYMRQFQEDYVAPEVDAYNFAKLVSFATDNNHVYAQTAANAAAGLLDGIELVQDVVGEDEELVIFAHMAVRKVLDTTYGTKAVFSFTDFKKGDIYTKVKTINDHALLRAPSARLKSEFQFLNGQDADQYQGGFVPTATAKDINYIIMPKKAAKLITKTQKIRVFDPDTNQKMDGWQFDYRRYYDLISSAAWQKSIVASITA